MPYKHIEDQRAAWRRYYQEHKEEVNARSKAWYEKKRLDPEFRAKRREYSRSRYYKKKFGLA